MGLTEEREQLTVDALTSRTIAFAIQGWVFYAKWPADCQNEGYWPTACVAVPIPNWSAST